MPDESDALLQAIAHAEDAFGERLGAPKYEDGLEHETHDSDVIKLRKVRRLLDACQLLSKVILLHKDGDR